MDLLTPHSTHLVSTSNYSGTADLHTLQINVAHTKSLPPHSVFICCCLPSEWQLPSNWTNCRVESSLMLQPTVSGPVCLGTKHHLGLMTRFLLLSDSCGFLDVGHSRWWEGRSAVCNCFWPLPVMNTHATTEELLGTLFYMWSVSYQRKVGNYFLPELVSFGHIKNKNNFTFSQLCRVHPHSMCWVCC
jgi:hypothetical protein